MLLVWFIDVTADEQELLSISFLLKLAERDAGKNEHSLLLVFFQTGLSTLEINVENSQ